MFMDNFFSCSYIIFYDIQIYFVDNNLAVNDESNLNHNLNLYVMCNIVYYFDTINLWNL